MAAPRTKRERERDLAIISEKYLKLRHVSDIAIEIGRSANCVRRDIKALHERWLQSSLVAYDKKQAQELAKIDQVERESWNAWECSRIATGKKMNGNSDLGPGDPRFLAMIDKCIERRCRIYGIDTPERDREATLTPHPSEAQDLVTLGRKVALALYLTDKQQDSTALAPVTVDSSPVGEDGD